jgi:O-antigen ligase
MKKTKILYGILLLTFVLAVFSGRRILMLPYLLLLIYYFKSIKGITIVFLSSAFIYILLDNFSFFDFQVIYDRFTDAMAGRGDSEARSEQHEYFWKYIGEKPFFGHGLGSYMPNYLRSDSFKTAYENTFDYLLFERGFIGVFLLFLYIGKMFINVYVFGKNVKMHIPILAATGTLILASYTNPYWMSSFDYTVPLAILLRFADSK